MLVCTFFHSKNMSKRMAFEKSKVTIQYNLTSGNGNSNSKYLVKNFTDV